MALLERVLETLVAQNASNIKDYLLAGGKGKQNTATLSVQVFALVNDVTHIQYQLRETHTHTHPYTHVSVHVLLHTMTRYFLVAFE